MLMGCYTIQICSATRKVLPQNEISGIFTEARRGGGGQYVESYSQNEYGMSLCCRFETLLF